jgi:hypothetical protein
MKLIRNLSWAVLLMWMVGACLTPPEYPITPQISFKSIYYGKATTPGRADSIVLSIGFKDGDGDLGLNDSYNNDERYAFQFYFFDSQNKLVTYKTKRLNPNLTNNKGDKLYDFVSPYNCTNWEVKRNNSGLVTDTVYTEYNPNYYNILVDFYVNNGTKFEKFDPATYFKYPNCSIEGFSGRFPVLSKDPNKSSPLDGVINYSMKSSVFDLLFSSKQLKLKIAIQDRALHKSDTITTEPFTLLSIRRSN